MAASCVLYIQLPIPATQSAFPWCCPQAPSGQPAKQRAARRRSKPGLATAMPARLCTLALLAAAVVDRTERPWVEWPDLRSGHQNPCGLPVSGDLGPNRFRRWQTMPAGPCLRGGRLVAAASLGGPLQAVRTASADHRPSRRGIAMARGIVKRCPAGTNRRHRHRFLWPLQARQAGNAIGVTTQTTVNNGA